MIGRWLLPRFAPQITNVIMRRAVEIQPTPRRDTCAAAHAEERTIRRLQTRCHSNPGGWSCTSGIRQAGRSRLERRRIRRPTGTSQRADHPAQPASSAGCTRLWDHP
ncbi:MAG: hypothetical protein JWM63_3902 [Gammaproteobacteria bacterium]|jgi:hypothetical protein|nr:hypothetical protein [Gammaproteobacteria bacterium]